MKSQIKLGNEILSLTRFKILNEFEVLLKYHKQTLVSNQNFEFELIKSYLF